MTAQRFIPAAPDRSSILIRVLVGAVFLSEGIQKFLFAAQLGAGRFVQLGFPHPGLLAPIVGATEIISGLTGALLALGVIYLPAGREAWRNLRDADPLPLVFRRQPRALCDLLLLQNGG